MSTSLIKTFSRLLEGESPDTSEYVDKKVPEVVQVTPVAAAHERALGLLKSINRRSSPKQSNMLPPGILQTTKKSVNKKSSSKKDSLS